MNLISVWFWVHFIDYASPAKISWSILICYINPLKSSQPNAIARFSNAKGPKFSNFVVVAALSFQSLW